MKHLAAPGTEDFFAPGVHETDIPNKLYFRTGEVARLASIKPYVLRFWETEFPSLGPKKSGTGHRLYRRKDVEMVFEIKRLLYEKRFTIAGARQLLGTKGTAGRVLEARRAGESNPQGELFSQSPSALVGELRRELSEILAILK